MSKKKCYSCDFIVISKCIDSLKVPLNNHTPSSSPQSSFASTPHTCPFFDGYYEFCTSSSTMNCLVGPFLFLWPLYLLFLPKLEKLDI